MGFLSWDSVFLNLVEPNSNFKKMFYNQASFPSYERFVEPSRWAGPYGIQNHVESEPRMGLNIIEQRLDSLKLLDQKLDQLLGLKKQESTIQPTSSPYSIPSQSVQGAYNLYPMHTPSQAHYVSEYPIVAQSPFFIQNQGQTVQGYSVPNNIPFSNTYNLDYRNHSDFSW